MAVYKCTGKNRLDDNDQPICNYEALRPWHGRCPKCHGPYAMVRVGSERVPKAKVTAAQSVEIKREYIATGHEHFDYVLSGGLVKGGVIVFGGPHGSGKSSLTMTVLDSVTKKTHKNALYVSGEESDEAVLAICQRVGVVNEKLEIKASTRNVYDIINYCREVRPLVTVFDSLQRMSVDGSIKPTVAENEVAAAIIVEHCEKSGMIAIIINHMNKALEFKGSTEVPHMGSTEMMLYRFTEKDDGDPEELFGRRVARALDMDKVRTLMVGKNRHGEEGRKVFFTISEAGLEPLAKKSKLELV